MLLAFLLQSYATQTHFHFPGETPAAASALDSDAPPPVPVKKNAPSPVNPDNCPLCQLLYGGQYVAPANLIFFAALTAVSTIAFELGVPPHYDAVSHSWRGRAPPQARFANL